MFYFGNFNIGRFYEIGNKGCEEGVWGKRLWLVSDARLEGGFSSLKEEQVRLLRFWMYMEAKSYPNESGIYVNEEMLVLNLEEAVFNQDRGVFLVNVLSF